MTPSNDPHHLSTTAGDLSLEEYHLSLEGRAWRILHTGAILSLADEQRFLDPAQEQPHLPYGTVLWPAAIALAHEIASRPVRGRGRSTATSCPGRPRSPPAAAPGPSSS